MMQSLARFLATMTWLGLATTAVAQSDSQRAGEHINLGVDYWEQQDYQRAIAEFSQAIAIWPYGEEGSTAYYNRGIVYELMRHCGEALADYDLAVIAFPGNQMAQQGRDRLQSCRSQVPRSPDPAKDLEPSIIDNPFLPGGPVFPW